MENVEITVIVMTYNHKDYIAKAVQSILNQKIDVKFNVLIHDDCSDDGAYDVLVDLQKNNKDKIKIIRQENRKFLLEGFNQMIYKYVVPNINCRFVAFCDGDDYWIDENKLKKQYDFMVNHNEYSMCFHSAYQLRQNNDLSSKLFIKPEGDIGLKDLICEDTGVCVATSSIFLKSDVFKEFPNWRLQYPVEDVPMYIHAAMKGKIHRLKDIMCVYRQFSSGSWSSQNKDNINRTINHLLKMKESVDRFDCETENKYHDLVTIQINAYNFRIALLENNFPVVFDKKYRKMFRKLALKERASLFLQYRMPSLYRHIKRH